MSNIKNLTNEEREQIFREVLHEHNMEEARGYCERFLHDRAINLTDEEIENDLSKLDFSTIAHNFECEELYCTELDELTMDLWSGVTDNYLYNYARLNSDRYDI